MRLALLLALAGCGVPARGQAPVGDAATTVDAGPAAADDGGAPEDAAVDASRCTVTSDTVKCDHEVTTIADLTGTRQIAYATPLGAPPAAGWPVAFYFQGSFVPAHAAFAAARTDPFGVYELARTIAALLDRGYAVLAPDTVSGGTTFWQTNIPPYAQSWPGCTDDVFVKNLFAAIAQGAFGPLDPARLYAMGISSGGFMTSRMAVSYSGRFRALAVHSGSYATCSATCVVPTPLPQDHPPTLFVHGDTDDLVPMSSVQPYLDALKGEGHETNLVTEADAGHEWLAAAVAAVPAWFDAHP
jgi:poly(3-hydroxybutyrate) depolymerase